jgi:hypothetical protein
MTNNAPSISNEREYVTWFVRNSNECALLRHWIAGDLDKFADQVANLCERQRAKVDTADKLFADVLELSRFYTQQMLPVLRPQSVPAAHKGDGCDPRRCRTKSYPQYTARLCRRLKREKTSHARRRLVGRIRNRFRTSVRLCRCLDCSCYSISRFGFSDNANVS